MRRALPVLVCLLCVSGPAASEETPFPPRTLDAARALAERAHADGDGNMLARLAEQDAVDPWLIADELCRLGKHDPAEALARASDSKAVAGLVAYVAGRRDEPPAPAGGTAIERAEEARTPEALTSALTALDELRGQAGSVLAVRAAFARGLVLRRLNRLADSFVAFEKAATDARALGWLTRTCDAWSEAGESAILRGDLPGSLRARKRALEAAEALADTVRRGRSLNALGNHHNELADPKTALSFFERALEARRSAGDAVGVAGTLINIGTTLQRLNQRPAALARLREGVQAAEAAGKRQYVAYGLHNIGSLLYEIGRYEDARDHLLRALREKEALGDTRSLPSSMGLLGDLHLRLGEPDAALDWHTRGLQISERLGHLRGVAQAYLSIGSIHDSRSDYPRALTYYQRARKVFEQMGLRVGVAQALVSIGDVHGSLGRYPLALSHLELALEHHRAAGDAIGTAHALNSLGGIYFELGDAERAMRSYAEALTLALKVGIPSLEVDVRIRRARVLSQTGRLDEARSEYEGALLKARELREAYLIAHTQLHLGGLLTAMGDTEAAVVHLDEAVRQGDVLGARELAADGRRILAWIHLDRGEHAKGIELMDGAVRQARRLRANDALVDYLGMLAMMHLLLGEPAPALLHAQEALGKIDHMLGGLGETEGAMARAWRAPLFEVGALAAILEGKLTDALTFIDSGRAGSLLETLGGREFLQYGDLPAEVRHAEAEASRRALRARRDYDQALAAGKRAEIRKAGEALTAALEAVRSAVARIQREAKREAGLFYPKAATLEEVQRRLRSDQALVLYAVCMERPFALVVMQTAARAVELEALPSAENALRVLSARDQPAGPVISDLRRTLVEPLALDKRIREVIVSPAGPLSYIPFSAVFEQPVSVTPSASTHDLLMSEVHPPGTEVLALGNPDYAGVSEGSRAVFHAGRPLAPLPATRGEAETVGTSVLLGKEANEAKLRTALTKARRWRAVHFACHGLIDAERPMLSSLALSSADEEDGFLTAHEVLRMRIPADLAVLSACETGTGKIVKGEGILGLTRAFMYAGASRILCSLWKVDDDATRALMVKFYELWAPKRGEGLGAAAALKQAQAWVRSKEKWKHPYYWAAWTLWGRPD